MSLGKRNNRLDCAIGESDVGLKEVGLPDQALFTLREAATIFKVHVRTIERWIEEKRLVAIVLPGGKSLRIPYQEMVKVFSQTTT